MAAGKELKCGLILVVHDSEIDAGDWQGSTEIYTDRPTFVNRVKELFEEYVGEDVEGTSIANFAEHEKWDDFVEAVWIEDRF